MHRSQREKRSPRSPSPRRRSSRRRSPSPQREERGSGSLPESFSRIHDDDPRFYDDQNVLQRMRSSFKDGPLHDLYECIENNTKIKVFTRNHKEVRGICTGYLLAFDKHWNLAMRDVTEIYLKPRKPKTPYLWSVAQSDIEALNEMEKKVPRKKKKAGEAAETEKEGESKSETEKEGESKSESEKEIKSESEKEIKSDVDMKTSEKETSASESASEAPAASDGKPATEKKKRKKKKNKDSVVGKRFVDQLFIRGDNVVMAVLLKFEEEDEENEKNESEKKCDDRVSGKNGKVAEKPELMETDAQSDQV